MEVVKGLMKQYEEARANNVAEWESFSVGIKD